MDRSGTQTVERAIALLKEIATHGSFGWRMTDLARQCSLNKQTTHRLLACLEKEGMLRRRPGDRRYLIGPLVFELALSRPWLRELQEQFRSVLQPALLQTDLVAYLYLRSGDHYVIAERVGNFRRSVAVRETKIGSRKPLVMAAGGVSILIALPGKERLAITKANMQRVEKQDALRPDVVRKMIRESMRRGYGYNDGMIIPGIKAMSVPLIDKAGVPFASIALAGIPADFEQTTEKHCLRILTDAAVTLQETLRQSQEVAD